MLSAPRRIGKSSFAKRLIDEKKSTGWKCAYIDLQPIISYENFIKRLIEEFTNSGLWNTAASTVKGIFDPFLKYITGVGPLQLDFTRAEEVEALQNSLNKVIDHTKDTLIVLDELTLLLGILDKDGKAGNLLNWLRSLRQVSDSKIRWIFCGSVGLRNFTQIRNLSMTINDMKDFHFDALSDEEANGLVKALAQSEKVLFKGNNVSYFLKKIGWYVPYFIQFLFNEIKGYDGAKSGVNKKIIDSAFENLVKKNEFNTWSERLKEYDIHEHGARLLLKELSKSETGLSKEQLLLIYNKHFDESPVINDNRLSEVLGMIEHDGYVMRTREGKRIFRSPLLRRWWKYKFVD